MLAELLKSKFVRRPSVCGIDYFWSYCKDFFQIFVVNSPGHMPRHFQLCVTMSAELMKSQFVRRPSSVRDTIISAPNARISFKFWLLLSLGHTPGRFLNFWKKKLLIFYE